MRVLDGNHPLGRSMLLLAAMALALGVVVMPAQARVRSVPDANDVDSPLDVSATWLRAFDKPDGHRIAIVGVRTFEAWSADESGPFLRVAVDSWGGRRADWVFRVFYDGGSAGWFCYGSSTHGPAQSGCGTTRTAGSGYDKGPSDTIGVKIPWHVLHPTKPMRWKVAVSAYWPDGPAEQDLAPDRGFAG